MELELCVVKVCATTQKQSRTNSENTVRLNLGILKHLLFESDKCIDDEREERRLTAPIRANENSRKRTLSVEWKSYVNFWNRADVFEGNRF